MWFRPDVTARTVIGHKIRVLAPEALLAAVPALLRVPGADRLKVDSGEHLAAILLTATIGTPSSVDTSGGLDLTFQRDESHAWPFGPRPTAAVETKSLPGPFRRLHRHQVVGDTFQLSVSTAAEILNEAATKLDQAAAQLGAKIERDTASANIFMAIHVFDGLAAEAFDETRMIGHLLPAVNEDRDLETLWVLWHPDLLAYWSREVGGWTDVIVAGYPPHDPRSAAATDESPLMTAEHHYLEAIGHAGGSPWLFRVTAAYPEAE